MNKIVSSKTKGVFTQVTAFLAYRFLETNLIQKEILSIFQCKNSEPPDLNVHYMSILPFKRVSSFVLTNIHGSPSHHKFFRHVLLKLAPWLLKRSRESRKFLRKQTDRRWTEFDQKSSVESLAQVCFNFEDKSIADI